MTELVRTVGDRVRHEHRDVIAAVDRCADAVASAWDGGRTDRRDAVVDPLRAKLSGAGVTVDLADVLGDVVDAAGRDLPASPVPAPPYVVVTSRGPILRATLEEGRLVVRFDAFAVGRGSEPRYRRLDGVQLAVSLEE